MSPSQAEPHSSPRAKSHSASQAEPSQHTKLEVNPATLEPKSPGTVLRETRSLLNKMDTVMAHAGNAMDAATFKLATSIGASDDMLQSLAERQAEAKAAKRLASAETLDSTDQIPSDQIPSDFSHVTATDADMHDPDVRLHRPLRTPSPPLHTRLPTPARRTALGSTSGPARR